jgi:isopentenyl diphosphate isomerase/L-lactate dehydrogenase-like FMN-dependent dehydrogenase
MCSAAASVGTIFTLSTVSSVSIEDVAAAVDAEAASSAVGATAIRFFQLYVTHQLDVNRQLIERAEKAGYAAIVVTVDVPICGKRRDDRRNGTQIPSHIQ